MPARIPIVQVGGQLQQLQAGDTLIAPIVGAQGISLTNDDVGSHIPGQIVYLDAVDGVKKAKADAVGTTFAFALATVTVSASVSGTYVIDGIITLTTAEWDAIMGTTGGLTFGTIYYLSAATAGLGSATAPSTVGQYVVRIGIAVSTTELSIGIRDPILL